MVRIVRSCMQSLLKMVNSVIGMVGIAMIMYALWLIRVWQRQMDDFPLGDDDPVPWFIYAFLGLGVALCVITCSGHIVTETANGCCLYLYIFFVFMFIILEAGVAADVFLNREWEDNNLAAFCVLNLWSIYARTFSYDPSRHQDFPEDPSGSFTQFKDFIRSNFQFCKWIGLSIAFVQDCLLYWQ